MNEQPRPGQGSEQFVTAQQAAELEAMVNGPAPVSAPEADAQAAAKARAAAAEDLSVDAALHRIGEQTENEHIAEAREALADPADELGALAAEQAMIQQRRVEGAQADARLVEVARKKLKAALDGEPEQPPAHETGTPGSSREVKQEEAKRQELGAEAQKGSDVQIDIDTELQMVEVVDKKSRRTRAKEALRRAGRRLEEKALDMVAGAIVRGKKAEIKNRENAVLKRIAVVDRDLARIPPDVLAQQDERYAGFFEAQHLYLEYPNHERSIDQAIHYERWQERRKPADPELAEAVAAAEQPIQDQIDAITATGIYGITFEPQTLSGGFETPWEYRGTPYESRRNDPRDADLDLLTKNNSTLMRLVGEKLAARNRVMAKSAGRGQSGPSGVQ